MPERRVGHGFPPPRSQVSIWAAATPPTCGSGPAARDFQRLPYESVFASSDSPKVVLWAARIALGVFGSMVTERARWPGTAWTAALQQTGRQGTDADWCRVNFHVTPVMSSPCLLHGALMRSERGEKSAWYSYQAKLQCTKSLIAWGTFVPGQWQGREHRCVWMSCCEMHSIGAPAWSSVCLHRNVALGQAVWWCTLKFPEHLTCWHLSLVINGGLEQGLARLTASHDIHSSWKHCHSCHNSCHYAISESVFSGYWEFADLIKT